MASVKTVRRLAGSKGLGEVVAQLGVIYLPPETLPVNPSLLKVIPSSSNVIRLTCRGTQNGGPSIKQFKLFDEAGVNVATAANAIASNFSPIANAFDGDASTGANATTNFNGVTGYIECSPPSSKLHYWLFTIGNGAGAKWTLSAGGVVIADSLPVAGGNVVETLSGAFELKAYQS